MSLPKVSESHKKSKQKGDRLEFTKSSEKNRDREPRFGVVSFAVATAAAGAGCRVM